MGEGREDWQAVRECLLSSSSFSVHAEGNAIRIWFPGLMYCVWLIPPLSGDCIDGGPSSCDLLSRTPLTGARGSLDTQLKPEAQQADVCPSSPLWLVAGWTQVGRGFTGEKPSQKPSHTAWLLGALSL